jgi:hypothetical protein
MQRIRGFARSDGECAVWIVERLRDRGASPGPVDWRQAGGALRGLANRERHDPLLGALPAREHAGNRTFVHHGNPVALVKGLEARGGRQGRSAFAFKTLLTNAVR